MRVQLSCNILFLIPVEYSEQKLIKGQSAQSKGEVMALIEKLDARARAIALFNLITVYRPSEMITIKIEGIDLDNCSVDVYMMKQSDRQSTRLKLECVNAIRAFIKEYGLTKESYLVLKLISIINITTRKSVVQPIESQFTNG